MKSAVARSPYPSRLHSPVAPVYPEATKGMVSIKVVFRVDPASMTLKAAIQRALPRE